MHSSVVNFDTPVNMVGGEWAQRRGSSFLIRRWATTGLALQRCKRQNDPGVVVRA